MITFLTHSLRDRSTSSHRSAVPARAADAPCDREWHIAWSRRLSRVPCKLLQRRDDLDSAGVGGWASRVDCVGHSPRHATQTGARDTAVGPPNARGAQRRRGVDGPSVKWRSRSSAGDELALCVYAVQHHYLSTSCPCRNQRAHNAAAFAYASYPPAHTTSVWFHPHDTAFTPAMPTRCGTQ